MISQDDVLDNIQVVARRVFANDAIQLELSTTAEDVAGWDSLTHVMFLLELEHAFGLRFPPEQMYAFESIGQLAAWIVRAQPAR
jgi:acyl carrier protein